MPSTLKNTSVAVWPSGPALPQRWRKKRVPPACQASLADQMFGESQVLADRISAPGLTNADLPILA
jgi:hypothetical protein